MNKRTIYKHDKYIDEYEEDRYGGSFGCFLRGLEVDAFSSLLGVTNGSLLDVGAGSGKLCIRCSSKARKIVAVDFSQGMLRLTKCVAESKGVMITTIVCDAHRLCFNNKSFDCVISSRLLLHLTDWKKGISELCRVSKYKVVFDFTPLFSFGGLDSLLKRFIKCFDSNTQTYKSFMVKSVVDELQKHNFHIAALQKQFFLPIAFHRWLDNPGFSERIENFFRIIGLLRLMGAPVTLMAERSDDA